MRKPRQRGEVTLPGTQNSWVVDFGSSSWCACARSLNHCAKIRCLLDEHKTTLSLGCSVWLQKRGHLNWAVSMGGRLGLRAEAWEEAGEQWEALSHPRVASFTSETSFCGAVWGGRKKREKCLPKFPFLSLSLGFLESDFPQMARAFFQCPLSVRCLMSHVNRKRWNWIRRGITGKGQSGRKWVLSGALKGK